MLKQIVRGRCCYRNWRRSTLTASRYRNWTIDFNGIDRSIIVINGAKWKLMSISHIKSSLIRSFKLMLLTMYLIALWSMCFPVAAAVLAADQRRIAAAVDSTLACSDIPGLALSVVGHGRVLFERGYGIASQSTRIPVTADTLFPLGSATKAFTTSLLALLLDKHASLPSRLVFSFKII